jgi:hypothetical protein
MTLFKKLCLAGALLAAGPAFADFQDGIAAIAQRDFTAALKAFKPLAEQGNAAAQVNLGNLYMKGLGVTQNYGEARRWYQSAADQGERMAQSKLGILFYYGLGVEKDPAEAARWFQKAADQGIASAQSILGAMYAGGEGVNKDLAKAYYWYTMAEEQGDAEAAKARQSLEEELSPGQKDEALRLMAEIKKQRGEQEEKAFEAATAKLGPPPVPKEGKDSKEKPSQEKPSATPNSAKKPQTSPPPTRK